MDDMINRHDSIAEENIEPNGRPAKDQFEEWSGEVAGASLTFSIRKPSGYPYSRMTRKTVLLKTARNV